jgi:hypothetical protein
MADEELSELPLSVERACQLAVFSGRLPSMPAEIDDKLPSNSR